MILFVCRGNMFRSPIAKALYNVQLKSGCQAESCGIWVDREGHAGVTLREMGGLDASIEYMKRLGMDISQERGTQINKELVDRADKIFVMAEEEIWPDYLINNPKVTAWDVPNPHVLTSANVEQIGDQIATLVGSISR